MAGIRAGLLREIVGMSVDTLRTNKMRSALTVLGVVIGITSIVGMTSLIRGFDETLRDSIRQLGPTTIFVQKMGALSFTAGKTFQELIKRPNIVPADARAIAELPSVALVDIWLMGGGRPRVYYGNQRTKPIGVMGVTENFAAVGFMKLEHGRFLVPDRDPEPPAGRSPGTDAVSVAIPEHRSDRQESSRRHA